MTCHQCGKNLPEDSRFCPYCGAAQPVQPPEPVQASQPPQAVPPAQPVRAVQPPQPPQAVPPVQPPQAVPPVQPVQPVPPVQPVQAVPPVQTGPVLNGAAFSGVSQFVPGVPVRKKSGKVIAAAFLTVAVVACAVCVLLFLNRPERRFASAMDHYQYETAGQLIDKIQNPVLRSEAVSRYLGTAETAIQDYYDGAFTYEEAEDLINRLSDGWPGEEMQEKWEKLQVAQQDMEYLKLGEGSEAMEDYMGAVICYLQIGEDSPVYGRVSKKLDDLREPYVLQMLELAQAFADQGKYEEALALLQFDGGEYLVYDGRVDEKRREYENAALGLAPDGRYLTVEGFIASGGLQDWLGMETDGETEDRFIRIEGTKNRIIFTYTYKNSEDCEDLSSFMQDFFASLANELKYYVAARNLVLEVRLKAPGGGLFASREFRAD